MKVTWKNSYSIPLDWNTTEAIATRVSFVNEMYRLGDMPTFYIDECGFDMKVNRSKGRSLVGTPAILTTLPKGFRISLIAAMGLSGYIHTTLISSQGKIKRGVNSDDFQGFLIQLVGKIPEGSLVIMDNCRIHHAETVTNVCKMLADARHITFKFLPPYSPFLNPIEYSFNKLKVCVSENPFKNRGELKKAIEDSLVLITAEDAHGFFQKAKSHYSLCRAACPFRGHILDPEIPQFE